MVSSNHDLCFLFRTGFFDETDEYRAVTVLKTDDTVTLGNEKFIKLEKLSLQRFQPKLVRTVKVSAQFAFNGSRVAVLASAIALDANSQTKRLRTVSVYRRQRW